MNLRENLQQNWKGGAIGAALAVAVGLTLQEFRFGRGLVTESYDLLLMKRPFIQTDEAFILHMDEDSHEQMQQPLNAPWDRKIHAKLLDRLTAEKAKAVVFDIVWSDPVLTNSLDDQILAQAIKNNGKVVLAAEENSTFYKVQEVKARQIIPPIPELSEHAAVGLTELAPDSDYIVRRHLPASADDQLFQMGWVTAQLIGVPIAQVEKQRFAERWINYYGPSGMIPNASYSKAFASDGLPAGFFSNKVVFVGSKLHTVFAGERKDEFSTPYSFWLPEKFKFMSGVEVHATIFLNLLRSDWLTRLPSERLLFICLGILVGFALAPFRPWEATGVAVVLAVLVVTGSYLQFLWNRIWFAWAIVVVGQIPAAWTVAVIAHTFQLLVQKRLYEHTLGLYLSPKLVKKFSKDDRFRKPGAEKQTLTILFSDIAGFTSISEGMDSDELAKAMNQYFQKSVTECIFATEGTVVKYIGDAIFAFWNAPEEQTDHQWRACQSGILFRKQEVMQMNGQPLITRIGLHTGVANVGNFGSNERVDYTALGENINLASRMEGLNKYLGTICLATGETHSAVADKVTSRYCGRFRLKGFDKAVEVHELLDMADQAEVTRPWREAFAAALAHFKKRDFATAEAGFRRVLELSPNDGPSKFYLVHLPELQEHPPESDWTGEVELKEK